MQDNASTNLGLRNQLLGHEASYKFISNPSLPGFWEAGVSTVAQKLVVHPNFVNSRPKDNATFGGPPCWEDRQESIWAIFKYDFKMDFLKTSIMLAWLANNISNRRGAKLLPAIYSMIFCVPTEQKTEKSITTNNYP